LVEHSVQALDESGRVFEWHAFKQKCLVKEKPRSVFNLAAGGVAEQLPYDLVIGVDLECRLRPS
jgi:hypothetical protein